jgi:hypothetical protein
MAGQVFSINRRELQNVIRVKGNHSSDGRQSSWIGYIISLIALSIQEQFGCDAMWTR